MNLEFMCCILYGLSDIFNKDDRRKRKRGNTYDIDDDCTLNIVDADISNKDLNFERTHSIEKSLLPKEIRK